MTKCDNCNKGITSKSPGLECRSCGKIVHASKACSGLAAKQLSALRNTGNLDWTCEECKLNSPDKRSSFFVPNDEEDEDEEIASSNRNLDCCNINGQKFLNNITAELKKVLKKELQPIETSINFCSDKVDELTKTVEAQNKRIKELEKKCSHLYNEKSHLELEMSSLKQYLRSIEQQRLDNVVEVVGIPKAKDEDLLLISNKLAEIYKVNKDQIVNTKRVNDNKDREGNIQIELNQVEHASTWVRESRKEEVLVKQILPQAPVGSATSKIILRRALTKANKSLLWLARQQFRPTYKYVWFQDGKVLLRKGDKDKPVVVRSEKDIEKLSS